MVTNYFVVDALGCVAAVIVFSAFLVPPGYLFATITDIAGFRARSLPLQILWSIVLSMPIALVLSAVVGRYLSTAHTLVLFELIFLAALAHVAFRLVPRFSRPRLDSNLRAVLLSMLALGAYLVLATSSIQVGQRLFESVNSSDWSVRIPLVGAALRNGVPPGNPLFAFEGVAQPSRYYFFWYALCAQVGRLTGLSARACLSGSVLWAGFGLAAVLFLYLKYFAEATTNLRRQCLLALGLCCVMGIDIVPAILGLFQHPLRLAPEIEWWRADRLPSFLGALIFAPHHIGGIVCAATGFLLLALTTLSSTPPSGRTRRWTPYFVSALGAGVCFAATAGTSTYIAFCFAFICVLYGIDRLRSRDWLAVGALVLSGVIAIALSRSFLHEMLSGPAVPSADPGGAHYFKLVLRDLPDARRIVAFLSRRMHHEILAGPLSFIFAAPILVILLISEAGFFLFPLWIRVARDVRRLRSGESFSAGEKALWACFLGAAIPALFISSEPTQHVNDLGRHAGLILRLILIVWSTPIVYEFVERRRAGEPLTARHPRLAQLAVLLLWIGVATQIWQVVLERTFLIFVQHHVITPEQPFRADADLGARYFEMRKGLETVQSGLPIGSVIQGNPGSRYLSIAEFYAARQFAAGDSGCIASFGGDPERCKVVVAELQKLYGGPPDTHNTPIEPFHTNFAPDAESTTTVETIRQVCAEQRLAILIAMDSDPAWSFPRSWVWQQPLYATPRIRFLACPSTSGALVSRATTSLAASSRDEVRLEVPASPALKTAGTKLDP